MVNLPPDPNDGQPPSRLRDNDEAIAVAIAFLAVGAILWWGWTRGQRMFAPSISTPTIIDESLRGDASIIGLEDGEQAGDRLSRFSRQFRDEEVEVEEESSARVRERQVVPESRSNVVGQTVAPVTVPRDPEAVAIDQDEAGAAADPDAATQTPPPLDISDVSEDYWAYPYIVDLYEKDLLPDLPSGQLQPDKQLTRAEFAALLNSSFVQNEPGQRDLNFSDIAGDYWAANAIQQVVDAGYMSGYPDGEFKPDQIVPRYQVLVTLASGLGMTDPANPQEILSRFQGAGEVPNWAQGKVAAAADNQLLVNYPNPQSLAPQQPATRAEIIVMIHQALLSQGRVEEISSPYVNP